MAISTRACRATELRSTSSAAPRLEGERAHRKSGEHLDAYVDVSGVRVLHDELVGRGAPIIKPLEDRPWGTVDFYVEDSDGYILCFSEAVREVHL
jgi:uncharacterized glyoxalase superfamily protein PhnB